MSEEEKVYKRRVRYSGKYPKSYKEKYKELNPEKYGDTVSRVIEKGSTPAGMHIPIMVNEILEFLQIKPGQIGLDATLGYGGHSVKMLEKLEGTGHLYGLDVDPLEIIKTRERLAALGYGEDILSIKQVNFQDIEYVMDEKEQLNFVLADLGVSSMQIDNPDRGFSYKTEGPLDLRMNPEKGISATQRLQRIKQEELEGMLVENSDEPHATIISRAIVEEIRRGTFINTTTKLQKIIEDTLEFLPEDTRDRDIRKTCARTFQALRIDVNREYEALYDFLDKLPEELAPGARVAILSFHSGEDRLVKKSFRKYLREGVYSEVASEIIRPTAEECRNNGRAKSTKMRWAIKA